MKECKGVVWSFSWLAATGWRFCHKTLRMPAKCVYCVCVYCVWCTLSPLWLAGLPAISVSGTSQQFRVGQIVWFGCLSAISQLARRVGEGGGVWQLCLHSITQPYTTWPRWREQGGGLRSLPLGMSHGHLKGAQVWDFWPIFFYTNKSYMGRWLEDWREKKIFWRPQQIFAILFFLRRLSLR